MTEVIKGAFNKIIENSIVACVLLIGLYFVYGDGKQERTQHLAALNARVAEAEKLARIVEQNSEALKQGQHTMQEVKMVLTTEIREMRQTIERAFVWAKPANGGGS